MPQPETHYFDVRLNVKNNADDTILFKLPSWTPGYYHINDYAQNVLAFKATGSNDSDLIWYKTAKNAWQVIANKNTSVTITYKVYGFEQSVDQSYLDFKKAFISPTSMFMHIEGKITQPVSLIINPFSEWKTVSTGLAAVEGKPYTFLAEDFNKLYDCPILIGNHKEMNFTIDNIPYTLALEYSENVSEEIITDYLTKIIRSTTTLMGHIPYKKYTFIMMRDGKGGLEHRNSMVIFSEIPSFEKLKEAQGWLSYVAHEFFHLYNVKSIRPIALGPFDYDKENYTNMLWVSEGFTVYYEYVILNRAGLMNRAECYEGLSNEISSYENVPGHLFQSATQSSFDAWIDFFNFRPNKRNTSISYYNKGCALGMLLDLKIRNETNNAKSLDDVMRRLYNEFYLEKKRGFTDNEFRLVCEEIAGCNLNEIFEIYAPATTVIDYPKYLAYGGLGIDTSSKILEGVHLGADIRNIDNRLMVRFVELNSPAYQAGLSVDDEVTAVNGHPINKSALDKILSNSHPGDVLRFTVKHQDIQSEYKVKLGIRTIKTFEISKLTKTNELQEVIYKSWFVE